MGNNYSLMVQRLRSLITFGLYIIALGAAACGGNISGRAIGPEVTSMDRLEDGLFSLSRYMTERNHRVSTFESGVDELNRFSEDLISQADTILLSNPDDVNTTELRQAVRDVMGSVVEVSGAYDEANGVLLELVEDQISNLLIVARNETTTNVSLSVFDEDLDQTTKDLDDLEAKLEQFGGLLWDIKASLDGLSEAAVPVSFPNTIMLGDEVSGRLVVGKATHEWKISVEYDQSLSVYMWTPTGKQYLDTLVRITGPDGTQIAFNDDNESEVAAAFESGRLSTNQVPPYNSAITEYLITAPGQYTIIADSYDRYRLGEETEGDYMLKVQDPSKQGSSSVP